MTSESHKLCMEIGDKIYESLNKEFNVYAKTETQASEALSFVITHIFARHLVNVEIDQAIHLSAVISKTFHTFLQCRVEGDGPDNQAEA